MKIKKSNIFLTNFSKITHVIQNNLMTAQLAGFARQLGCKKGGGKRDSANKQDSHFPIDLHCQPSQNGAEMYHGSDVIGNYLSQQIVSP